MTSKPTPRTTAASMPVDLTLEPSFPRSWTAWVDDVVPQYVKDRYAPDARWKGRPFASSDVRFFSKGIAELSELFTEDRGKGMQGYLHHPRFRSSYLLYFLPLQAAKFLSLLKLHPKAWQAFVAEAAKSQEVHVLDLGSGPGTASFALLHALLEEDLREFRVHLHWVDENPAILADGRALLEAWTLKESRLKDRVRVTTYASDVWKKGPWLEFPRALTLMGNVLNEGTKIDSPIWGSLFSSARGGGVLCVEPASKSSSQRLSRLRDHALSAELIPSEPESFWGPCFHAGACPMSEGRDWCHFSVPVRIPGRWFREFSESLASERQWAKFSYLWIASSHSGDRRAPRPRASLRRVLTDPLKDPQSRHAKHKGSQSPVLLCEPGQPRKHVMRHAPRATRGFWVELT